MRLPAAWVKSLFARLQVRYGTAWSNLWTGLDEQAVLDDWAEVLGHCKPEAIAYALENLPQDRPPNAQQFRAICIQRPEPVPPRLPAPKADPEKVAEAIAVMRETLRRPTLQWAARLRDRERDGDRLTQAQRDMWRQAPPKEPTTETKTIEAT
jgi:hypothetical protein